MRGDTGHEWVEGKCALCGVRKSKAKHCTGKGYYSRWSSIPARLKSVGQWKELGLRPHKDEKASAWVFAEQYGRGHFWAELWDETQVTSIKFRNKTVVEVDA